MARKQRGGERRWKARQEWEKQDPERLCRVCGGTADPPLPTHWHSSHHCTVPTPGPWGWGSDATAAAGGCPCGTTGPRGRHGAEERPPCSHGPGVTITGTTGDSVWPEGCRMAQPGQPNHGSAANPILVPQTLAKHQHRFPHLLQVPLCSSLPSRPSLAPIPYPRIPLQQHQEEDVFSLHPQPSLGEPHESATGQGVPETVGPGLGQFLMSSVGKL